MAKQSKTTMVSVTQDSMIIPGASLAIQYKRTSARPIDSTSTWKSMEDATRYARNTDAEPYVPYDGQNISIEGDNSLYILIEDETISKADGRNHFRLSKVSTEEAANGQYLSKIKENTAEKLIHFKEGIDVIGKTATLNLLVKELADIYDLNVSHVATLMGTIVKEYISSESFVSGFAGEGMKIYKALSGDWNMEIDNLTVRKVFSIFELMVQKITHQGGMVIRSAAGAKLTKVTDGGSYWKCEHDSTDDFVKDDQIICQSFTGTAIKRYWRLVTSSGPGYFNLSKADCEQGSGTPEAGDEVAVLGNRTVSARQKAQIDCAVGDTAPYRDDYDNINSYSLVGKLITRTGNLSGITDAVFGVLSGSGLYGTNVYLRGTFILKSGKKIEEAIADVENNLGARITTVETNFEIREGQISSKVTEATVAAGNAKQSETNASGSALSAGTSATNAAKSASDALGAAANAGKILEEVTVKESSITQTAGQIATKVTEVNKKVVEAETAATNAGNSAASASGSASNAKKSADDAGNILEEVTAKESSINQTATQIELKASRAESAATRSEAAESRINISADGIVLEASRQAAQQAVNSIGKIYIRGTGLNRNASPAVVLNNNELLSGYTRGLNLVVIKRSDLTVYSRGSYDTYGDYGSQYTLTDYLNSLTDDVIVIIVSYDACGIVIESLSEAIKRCGGSGLTFSPARYPYAFIGIPNIGQGNGVEIISGLSLDSPYAEYSTTITNGIPEGVLGSGSMFTTQSEYEAGIKVLSDSINLKASKEEFDTLGIRVGSAEASISAQAGQISSKASQTSVNALTGRMETAESSITQNAREISLKVSASEAGSIADGKVGALKGDLQATGIDIANRKITVTSDTFQVQDNYGNAIAVFKTDATGKPVVKAENIDVENLKVKKLDGATGSFKELQAVDNNGIMRGRIAFNASSNDGDNVPASLNINFSKTWISGDLHQQGYNDSEGRSLRFYTSDLWCRGGFGAREYNSIYFRVSDKYNSTINFYTKGLSKPPVLKTIAPIVDIGFGSHYYTYTISLYGYSDPVDVSGFPINICMIDNVASLMNVDYIYIDLSATAGSRVMVINIHRTRSFYMKINGERVEVTAGTILELFNVGNNVNPSSSVTGWIITSMYKNEWK